MKPTKLLLYVTALMAIILLLGAQVLAVSAKSLKYEVNKNGDVKILLSTDKGVSYTSFSPDKHWIVIDLLGCSMSNLEPVYNLESDVVNYIKTSKSARGVRLEISLKKDSDVNIVPQGEYLIITIKKKVEKVASSHSLLRDVKFDTSENGFKLNLKGTGLTKYRKFYLTDPDRLVVDLLGAGCSFNRKNILVNDGLVKRVRISRFQNQDPKIVRVVLDLNKKVNDAKIIKRSGGLSITLGKYSEENSEVRITDGNVTRIKVPVVKPKKVENKNRRREVRFIRNNRVHNAGPNPVNYITDDTKESVKYTGEPITLDLKDADIIDFFRLISELENLNIVVDPSVHGTISIKVKNVPWDQVFDLALKNNGLDKVIEGNVVRIATLDALREEAKKRKEAEFERSIRTEIIPLNYVDGQNLIKFLGDVFVSHGGGKGAIAYDAQSNTIIIRDIPDRIAEIKKVISTLDVPQRQVEIEARILAASRSFARSIGIQAGFVAGNLERITVGGTNTFAGLSGYRPAATVKSGYVAGNPATGKGASESNVSESAAIVPGGNGDKGNYNINLPAEGATSGIGIAVGNIFDTFLLDASLTAAESEGKVRIISQPKIQTQNNQPATIEQGLQFPVQTVENNTVTTRFFSASLMLQVLPTITDEGTVNMLIKLENNRADFSKTVNGIPSIVTSRSETNVLVADGGTTMIGGILIDQEENHQDKVPLFGSIPIIGNLFKRQTKSKDSKEVLFFLTPRIVR